MKGLCIFAVKVEAQGVPLPASTREGQDNFLSGRMEDEGRIFT
jgi:hypothetical protein